MNAARWLPPAASAHAAEIDTVVWFVHALILALFVGWSLYFAWVLVRSRRPASSGDVGSRASRRVVTGVEIAIVVAEAALLIGLALPAWSRQTLTPPSAARVVRVVAEQFAWNVHYPGADGRFGTTRLELVSPANPIGLDRQSADGADDFVLPNDLRVPVGEPVVVQLSSKDVIHSFGVPAMRIKRDVIPGQMASVWFTPTHVGTYDVACSQLCGTLHYRMRALITVESAESYGAFTAAQAARLPR